MNKKSVLVLYFDKEEDKDEFIRKTSFSVAKIQSFKDFEIDHNLEDVISVSWELSEKLTQESQ